MHTLPAAVVETPPGSRFCRQIYVHTFLMLPARPRGRTLPARTARLSLCILFCICSTLFFSHFPLFFLLSIYMCILFSAFLSPSFFGFVGREAAVCTAGKSPETRINKGFARVCIFLKIFLKSSQVFLFCFLFCVFFCILYMYRKT